MNRHRVVQWATGNIGTRSRRAVIEPWYCTPDLDAAAPGIRTTLDLPHVVPVLGPVLS